MMYGNYPWGHMWWGWLFWIVIAVVVVWAITRAVNSSRASREVGPSGESALEILKKRYARGEISKEQFDQMKKDMES